MKEITKLVADHFNIPMFQLFNKGKKGQNAYARQIAIYLTREFTKAQIGDIADYFLRKHSTVIHSHATIKGQIEVDKKFRLEMDGLTARVREIVAEMEAKITYCPYQSFTIRRVA